MNRVLLPYAWALTRLAPGTLTAGDRPPAKWFVTGLLGTRMVTGLMGAPPPVGGRMLAAPAQG